MSDHPYWEICAEASNGEEAVALAALHGPEAVVMDPAVRDMDGVETIRQISELLPDTAIVLFCAQDPEPWRTGAMAAGARAFVLKSAPTEALIEALDALVQQDGRFFQLGRDRTDLSARRFFDAGQVPLTPREREIVQLIAEGKRTREIGRLLGISERTVETHRGAVMRKLQLTSLAEVVRYAIRNKLAEP